MKQAILLSTIASSLLLSGCLGNQQFDCPFKDGVRCLSVSAVDKQVSSGEIQTSDAAVIKKKKRKWFWQKDPVESKNPTNHYPAPSPQLSVYSPIRTQEEVVQIWVAAYEGEDGIYHNPTVLNTVLKEAQWVGTVPEVTGN
jgi:type IV conjugative transfer system lipoprotein TraV